MATTEISSPFPKYQGEDQKECKRNSVYLIYTWSFFNIEKSVSKNLQRPKHCVYVKPRLQ